MLLDKNAMLMDKVALSTSLNGTNTSDAYDLGGWDAVGGTFQKDNKGNSPLTDPGRSDIEILAQVTTTVTSAGAATLQLDLIHSDNSDLSSAEVLQSTGAVALAKLVAGYQFRLDPTPGITKRYLGVKATNATAAFTAGAISAGVVFAKNTNYTGL